MCRKALPPQINTYWLSKIGIWSSRIAAFNANLAKPSMFGSKRIHIIVSDGRSICVGIPGTPPPCLVNSTVAQTRTKKCDQSFKLLCQLPCQCVGWLKKLKIISCHSRLSLILNGLCVSLVQCCWIHGWSFGMQAQNNARKRKAPNKASSFKRWLARMIGRDGVGMVDEVSWLFYANASTIRCVRWTYKSG